MDLLSYLNQHFYTKIQLLEKSKISAVDFKQYQEKTMMPAASYLLNIKCDSFFGEHTQASEFFPKAYVSWLTDLITMPDTQTAFEVFSYRYKAQLQNLNDFGLFSVEDKFNKSLKVHIKQEWQHFLKGTYGVCTQSGLVEDIATKEFTTSIINELILNKELSDKKLKRLKISIGLLDSATALFAPHEKQNSSRVNLIESVKQTYF
ncbi:MULTISPECIES: DUF6058 family natural product biosynthesis protein [unclassified Pseudoalteromonas]|uniref:DUF6058 family natural product biosynthesis protein n=1 Tax=unclassified Pseudoalteromonas TaxID=194690 RepID=UPI0005AA636D|nr:MULTISPECIES: DUF6058 family natural product biosynthesis protein [unclassified Pseudoalteromonas]